MKCNALNNRQISNARIQKKQYTLADGEGLQLCIKTNGSKLWEFVYTSPTLEKRRKTSFGTYPLVSLKMARDKKNEWRQKIANQIDPLEERDREIVEEGLNERGQFHNVCLEWIKTLECSQKNKDKIYRALERDLFPYFCEFKDGKLIKSKHINEITHSHILEALRLKADKAPETVQRIISDCKRLWQFARAWGYTTYIIGDYLNARAFKQPQTIHYPKITDLELLNELYNAIDEYYGRTHIVRFALIFLCYIPLRVGNLVTLRWDMYDEKKQTITIPRNEMKVNNSNLPDFVIPLPDEIIELLHVVYQYTSSSQWIFHGADKSKPLNPESLNKALRKMGFDNATNGKKQTSHSFRGTFRSLCDTFQDEHKASYEVKEQALDHHQRNESVLAYVHKADYTQQLYDLLCWWACFVGRIKQTAFRT